MFRGALSLTRSSASGLVIERVNLFLKRGCRKCAGFPNPAEPGKEDKDHDKPDRDSGPGYSSRQRIAVEPSNDRITGCENHQQGRQRDRSGTEWRRRGTEVPKKDQGLQVCKLTPMRIGIDGLGRDL